MFPIWVRLLKSDRTRILVSSLSQPCILRGSFLLPCLLVSDIAEMELGLNLRHWVESYGIVH
jgi:hypothetical protein